jgi:hypothetical protein
MSDCSRHSKQVAGVSDMRLLAENIGDLHYETLQELFGRLSIKLYRDGFDDRLAGRQKLGAALNNASISLKTAASHIKEAWDISKPFMKQQNNG